MRFGPCGLEQADPSIPGAATAALVASKRFLRCPPKETPLSASDPNYDAEKDTYRVIHRGHDNASAVTNREGLTVFFDPDTSEVLGFQITNFSAYYEAHKTPDGEFEVNLPARVPAPLEEEMDFDEEQIRTGVRIAEFY